MRSFRLLTENEIECRISEIDKKGQYLKLLLYKTARIDLALLDEKYGAENWCNDYKEIGGKMYCGHRRPGLHRCMGLEMECGHRVQHGSGEG